MAERGEIAATRFGYGHPIFDKSPDAGRMIGRLRGPDEAAALWPGVALSEVLKTVRAYRTARMEEKKAGAKGRTAALKEVQQQADALALRGAQAILARAVGSPDGLRERLVQFWADHFTVTSRRSIERALPATLIEDAIRPHLAGRFSAMLRAVITHPAMLIYLDQVTSFGPGSRRGQRQKKGLNENLARELLELHTLGVSAGYGQDDVRQMAELLTGLAVDPDAGFRFEPNRAEPGAETVLGVRYTGQGTEPIFQALDDLAVRPETARHLAMKLAVHFVSDTPDPGLVGAIEKAWNLGGGDLLAVTEAMLGHPAAWAPDAAKARQPFDFIVAALRALQVGPDRILRMEAREFRRLILQPMRDMGQPWQQASGPNGWPEPLEDWITPQGLAARITWAMHAPARLVDL